MLGIEAVTPAFVKPINLSNILAQTAVIAIVAMGQQLVILTWGIDLSVGSNLALCTVIGGLAFQATDATVPVILAMLSTGALVGAVNGLVYVYGRLPHPFIITLATLSICRGLALALAPGHATMRGLPDAVAALGSHIFLGLPLGVFVVALVAGLLLEMTRMLVFGRGVNDPCSDRAWQSKGCARHPPHGRTRRCD